MPSPQSREQLERVFAGEVAFPERVALPPWCIADRQQRHVELTRPQPQRALHEQVRRVAQPGVAGEKTALIGALEEIHVCSCPPTIESIPVSLVPSSRGVD